jgi:hypothetical protein
MSHGSLRVPLAELVAGFCETARVDDEEMAGQMSVHALRLDLPVEVEVAYDGGRLAVLASPPTQRVATTFLPVFHRMSLRIEREEVARDAG